MPGWRSAPTATRRTIATATRKRRGPRLSSSPPIPADTHAAGGTTLAEDFTTCTPPGITLSAFPGHYLLDSAFDQLEGWVRQGRTPPHAPLIQATGTPPSLVTVLDAHGNAVGGVRAPELDVPVATYTESSGGASLN